MTDVLKKIRIFTNSDETDPVFSSSPAFDITKSDITNLENLSGTNTGDQDLSSYSTKSNTLIQINHGSTANTSRPSGYVAVLWVGSVEPTNAENNDVWIDTS